MSLNEETAGARNGTGLSEKHWCIGSIVRVGIVSGNSQSYGKPIDAQLSCTGDDAA
jgi:hypothetical protein